jgi:hypothetical protein
MCEGAAPSRSTQVAPSIRVSPGQLGKWAQPPSKDPHTPHGCLWRLGLVGKWSLQMLGLRLDRFGCLQQLSRR